MLRKALSFVYTDIKARVVRYYRTKEVVKTLELRHSHELADAPINMHAVIKAQHSIEIAAAASGKFPIVERRTWQHPYLPESLHRLHQPILKATPYNLRRFSETPIPRRAINLIKNTVLSLRWKVEPADSAEITADMEQRIRIATYNLEHPNNSDSWKTLVEAVLEDFLVGGYGTIEPALTPYYKRPFKLWAVDGSTIRIFPDWEESTPDKPRYAQMTGLKGERGFVVFRHDELFYIRDNVRTNTPFGLGRLEVCFNAVNAFLSAQDMATKAGGDQIHKTFLWWRQALSKGKFDQIRKYIRNEGEGQAKINMVSGMDVPDVLEANPVTEADLLLNWQEFLIRIIGTGFDISAHSLGVERDVNRATGDVLDTKDFRTGVVPVAAKLAEVITRSILHQLMEWTDLKFSFIGLEDPDILTKAKVFQQLWTMNAVTSNQIAESFNMPRIRGGWGELTFGQQALVTLKAQALLGTGKTAPGAAGAPGEEAPTNNFGGTNPGVPMTGSVFTAKEVAKMKPQQVNKLQKGGMLPEDPDELEQNMEDSEPGILETLSDELREYLEYLKSEKKEDEVKPKNVTTADEKEQQSKYRKNNKERFPQKTDRKKSSSPDRRWM